jgi:FG-GAP-like repeat
MIAAMVPGDWNGDGKVDLATVNAGTGDVTVVLGLSQTGFGKPSH